MKTKQVVLALILIALFAGINLLGQTESSQSTETQIAMAPYLPNQDSLLKLLYMGIQNASKKWTMPIQNWSLTISQLAIFFEGRLDKELKL